MGVLATSLAVAATVFPWACGEYRPAVSVVWESLPAPHYAYADRVRCQIRLDPKWRRLHPLLRCALMTHERGHLAGLAHSSNPRSVMYPTVSLRRPYKPCARALRARR